MRSRAAILPFLGDPFLFYYWLHFFDTVWGKEIDKLYITLNSPIEKPVVDFIKKLCDDRPKIKLIYSNQMGDHGPSITKTLKLVEENLVMLIEDDGFIFKPGIVDFCFSQLESGNFDIVGSKRGSCHNEILQGAQKTWGISYEGEGDQGPNFWPNFFFASKHLLMQTDQNFAAKAWHKGDYIKEMDHTVLDEVIYGDTFVNTSIQLRAIVSISRIYIVPQYHGSPDDLKHAEAGKYLFDGQAPWTHVGSLSSGVGGVLRDEYNRHLDKRLIAGAEEKTYFPLEWYATDQQKDEWERRIQWWLTSYEFSYTHTETDAIVDFRTAYNLAIQQVIDIMGLRIGNIRARQRAYRRFLGI